MALALPRAFWPVTITAGVNDKIDVKRTSDSTLFAATVAAGTYYTPQALARAVRDALHAVWTNGWGVDVIGTNAVEFNPSFEGALGTTGWAQYNNSSGLEPFTGWSQYNLWSSDLYANPGPRGASNLRMVWAVANTTTKGFWTQRLVGGVSAGIPWRKEEYFRIRLKARGDPLSSPCPLDITWNSVPSSKVVLLNPTLQNNVWQQYDWRVRYAAGDTLPNEGASGNTGELFFTVNTGQGGTGAWEADDVEVYSESTQIGHIAIGGNAAFQLLFFSGANAATSARDVLGWGMMDTGSVTTAVSIFQHRNAWYAARAVADDTGDLPTYERAQARALGGQTYGLDFATRYDRLVSLVGLSDYKIWKAAEGNTHANEALEHLWDDGWQRVRWWRDGSIESEYEDLVLDASSLKTPPRNRLAPGKAMYSLNLPFMKFVP